MEPLYDDYLIILTRLFDWEGLIKIHLLILYGVEALLLPFQVRPPQANARVAILGLVPYLYDGVLVFPSASLIFQRPATASEYRLSTM